MPEPKKEVSQAGNMSLEKVRAGYRDALKSTRREFLGKAGKTAAAVALGAVGLNALSSKAEAGGGLEHTSGLLREKILRAMPGNETASIWENWQGDQYRDIFKSIMSSTTDLTFEFDPKKANPTWRFYGSWFYSSYDNILDNSAFLDNSGRVVAGQGLENIIDSLPIFEPLVYHPADPKKTPFANHALVIPKEQVQAGFVMVFSRPDKPEDPNALYDRWENDTSVASDAVKIKGGHKAQHTVGEGYFLVIDTQDRTDRVTPFYNKDNPAKVEKVVVIFDSSGQAVRKFNLDKTDFYPRMDFMDDYEGNAALKKTELSFLDWYRLSREEQVARLEPLTNRYVSFNVDTADLRLHVVKEDQYKTKTLHLNIDPSIEPLPQFGSSYKGIPVEIIMIDREYQALKKKWDTEGGDSIPDLVVPKDMKLNFWVGRTNKPHDNVVLHLHSYIAPQSSK